MIAIKRRKAVFWLAGLLTIAPLFFIANITASLAAAETRLTPGSGHYFQPDISGNKVVWLKGTNDGGKWSPFSDVYLHTLGGSTVKLNSVRKGHAPSISGSDVVWEDRRNGSTATNVDIFGYGLPSDTETAVETQGSNQFYPHTDGGRVVWMDFRNYNWDVYLKDTDGSIYRITTDAKDQTEPRLDGDLIVFTDDRNTLGWDDIYVYDLSEDSDDNGTPNYKEEEGVRPSPDPAEVRITTNSAKQNGPDISGRKIVWTDWRSGRNIYTYDLDNPEVKGSPVDANAAIQHSARIDGDLVVWTDWRNTTYPAGINTDIYARDLGTGTTVQVTYNSKTQVEPDVSQGRVVWSDNRYGWDIFTKLLDDLTPPTGTIVINGGAPLTNSTNLTLSLSAFDSGGDVSFMRFSEDDSTWSDWEAYGTSKAYTLAGGDGTRTVYVRYRDADGNVSVGPIADDILLDQGAPTDPTISDSNPSTGTWTQDNTIEINWPATGAPGGASDSVSGVDGFSVSWSQNGTETPDTVKDLEESATSVTSPGRDSGIWWFNMSTGDNAGNWTGTVHYGPFYVDTEAPRTGISPASPDGNNDWYTTNPNIILTPDETAGTAYRWNGGASTTYTAPFSAPGNGAQTLEYYSVDLAGNREATNTVVFNIDPNAPTDPTISGSSPGTGDWTQDNTIEINWPATGAPGGASDSVSGVDGFSVSWSQNGTETPDTVKDLEESATSVTSPGRDSGIWWFNMSTGDNAGNWTGTVHYGPFKIDITDPANPSAPAIETSGAVSDTWQGLVSNPNFTWSPGSDSDSEFKRYYVYWGTNFEGDPTTPNTAAAYDPGPVGNQTVYYLRVKTEDNAGNISAPVTLFIFKYGVDNLAPTNPAPAATELSGVANNTWQNSISNPNFTWAPGSDADSGVSGYYVYWGTNPAGTPTTNFTTSPAYNPGAISSPSTFYLRVKTKDNAGNQAGAVTLFTFKYDNAAPTGSIKIRGGAAYTKSTAVTLSLTASDMGSGLGSMRFQNGSGSWSAWESIKTTKSWTLSSSQGQKTVNYNLRDKVGNTKTYSDKITLDTKKPSARMTTPFVSTRISKTTTFKVKWWATDASPSSGIKNYTVKYRRSGSSVWRTYRANTTAKEALFKGKAGVTYYFRTTALDKAGNTGLSKVYKTIVPFNEGNSLLRRIGFNGYKKLGRSQNYLTSVRYSYKRGHTLIYKLYKTNGIGLVVTKGPKMGRAKIYVDGKFVGIVDAKSSKIRPRQLIFYRNLKKKGTHYLKVVNLGTPGRARFEVDAVVVKR